MAFGSDSCCLAWILYFQTLAIQGRCLGLDCSGAVFCTWGASILRKADKQRASQRRFLEAFFRSRLLRDELSRLPRFYGTGRPCGGVFRGSMGVPSPSVQAGKRLIEQIYGASLRWTAEGGCSHVVRDIPASSVPAARRSTSSHSLWHHGFR